MADEEESARRLKEMQALARSNSALRCLVSLHSLRTGDPSRRVLRGESATELPERFERLIGAVKLLREDLQMERMKTELRNSRQFRADIARFVLFVAGGLATIAILMPDFPGVRIF